MSQINENIVDRIRILDKMARMWSRTAAYLLGASLILFSIFVYGLIRGTFPITLLIVLLAGIAAFFAGGVEFSLRVRINRTYIDLLEMIQKEYELQKVLTLDDLPE